MYESVSALLFSSYVCVCVCVCVCVRVCGFPMLTSFCTKFQIKHYFTKTGIFLISPQKYILGTHQKPFSEMLLSVPTTYVSLEK